MGVFDYLIRRCRKFAQWMSILDYPDEDSESISLLEELPEEMLWKIIGFVPEAIPALRLTSQLIRYRVDQYALSTNNIVHHIVFRMPPAYIGIIQISMLVPKYDSSLFQLRCKLLDPHNRLHSYISALSSGVGLGLQKFSIGRSKKPDQLISFKVSFDIAQDEEYSLQLLRDLIGNCTRDVHLNSCSGLTAMLVVAKVLQGINFSKLHVSCRIASKNYLKHICDLIRAHNVNLLQLATWKIDLSDPATFIKFGSFLRTMHFLLYGSNREINGNGHIDWASIFTQMLSRKLDRFEMCCETHLDDKLVDELRERLPNIGRNIIFSAMCINCRNQKRGCNSSDEILEYTVNNYNVRVDRSYGQLDVFHSSRVNERDS